MSKHPTKRTITEVVHPIHYEVHRYKQKTQADVESESYSKPHPE